MQNLTKIVLLLLTAFNFLLLSGCGGSTNSAIEVTCAINGFGFGKCTFTNTGNAAGNVCGVISITESSDAGGGYVKRNPKSIDSNRYCSGKVLPSSSAQLDVHISGFTDLCNDTTCTYQWIE